MNRLVNTRCWFAALIAFAGLGCGDKPTDVHREKPAALLSRLYERPVIRPGSSPREARQEYLNERLRVADQLLEHPDADAREREWATLAKLQLLFRAAREEPQKYQPTFEALMASSPSPNAQGLVATTIDAMRVLGQLEQRADQAGAHQLITLVQRHPANPASEMLILNGAAALERQRQFALGREFCAQAGDLLDSPPSQQRLAGFSNAFEILGQPVTLSGKDMDGKPFDLSELKGKVVLVDFWASWCEPCQREWPVLKSIHDRFKSRSFEIVGISIDSEVDKARIHLAQNQLPWKQLYAKPAVGMDSWSNPFAKKLRVSAIPANFLLDRQGIAISRNVMGEAQLVEAIEKALQ